MILKLKGGNRLFKNRSGQKGTNTIVSSDGTETTNNTCINIKEDDDDVVFMKIRERQSIHTTKMQNIGIQKKWTSMPKGEGGSYYILAAIWIGGRIHKRMGNRNFQLKLDRGLNSEGKG